MADAIAYFMGKAFGVPGETNCISKIELHDHQPENTVRIILCTEKNAWCRNISVECNNGNTYGINVGQNYGRDHEKVKWDVMNVDLSGASYMKIAYSKMKIAMTILDLKELNQDQINSLKTKTFIMYWPNDDSNYFNDAGNRVSPGQLGI